MIRRGQGVRETCSVVKRCLLWLPPAWAGGGETVLHPSSGRSLQARSWKRSNPKEDFNPSPRFLRVLVFQTCLFAVLRYLAVARDGENQCTEDNSLFILHCSDAIAEKAGNGGKRESQAEEQIAREFRSLGKDILRGFLIACAKGGIRHPLLGHSALVWFF